MIIDLDKKVKWVSFILRVGISFTLVYAGISAFLNPSSWVGFIPGFVEIIVSRESLLIFHSIFNLILGLWILSNWKVFYASILAGIFLFGIIVFNLGAFDIVFRDISILLAVIALGILSYEKN